MRHNVAGYKLDRTTGARKALRRNLIKQFFEHERIHTTKAKAAAIRGEAEKIITIARNSANASDMRGGIFRSSLKAYSSAGRSAGFFKRARPSAAAARIPSSLSER